MTFVQTLTKKLEDFLKKEDNALSIALARLEALSGVSRLTLAISLISIFGGYMIFGFFAQLICNMIGFLYPAYVSLVALDSPQSDQNHQHIQQLLRYWVVFAFMSVGDFWAGYIFRIIPFYWLFKAVFLVWCLIPLPNNGTTVVYFKCIQPLFRQIQPLIDNSLQRLLSPLNGEHQQ